MFRLRRKVIASGERTHIIAPTRDTAAEFIAFAVANQDFHRPWVFPATDISGYRNYLERLDGHGAHGFMVVANDDNTLVGVVNINDVVLGGQRSGSLGYYGSKAHARQRLMADGLGLVLDQAFGPLTLHRLEANVQPGNAPSLALITSLGFRREGFSPSFLQINGVWRDHERWAICEDEWRLRRASPRRPLSRVV